jgi:hypothetical protein
MNGLTTFSMGNDGAGFKARVAKAAIYLPRTTT